MWTKIRWRIVNEFTRQKISILLSVECSFGPFSYMVVNGCRIGWTRKRALLSCHRFGNLEYHNCGFWLTRGNYCYTEYPNKSAKHYHELEWSLIAVMWWKLRIKNCYSLSSSLLRCSSDFLSVLVVIDQYESSCALVSAWKFYLEHHSLFREDFWETSYHVSSISFAVKWATGLITLREETSF